MNVPINDLKRIIDRFENTIYPDDQTSVIIPILLDFADLKYDQETVKTYNVYFTRIDGVWHINF